ncbi:Hcp family type VI secretion system effector [Muriicola sp. E247]|uniref:Hcp family type VI secretion system effector n=1 Tax=Muriicola sp. E247 TaxID=3242730 RepID=UPI00352326F6
MKTNSIVLTGLALLFCVSLSFAQSGYLKIGDIKGESTERAHKDWIIIESFSQGIATAPTSTGATRQRSAALFEDLMVTKKIDKATPKLMEACAKGQVFPDLEMDMVTANGRLYYKITLRNVRVKSVRTTSGDDAQAKPVDEMTFSFSQITWEYWDSAGNKTEATYNLETGR